MSEMERYNRRGWSNTLVDAIQLMAPIYDLIENRDGQFDSLEYSTLEESIARDLQLVDANEFPFVDVLEAARQVRRFESFLLPVDPAKTDIYWRFSDAVFGALVRSGKPIDLTSHTSPRISTQEKSVPGIISWFSENSGDQFVFLDRKVSASERELILRRPMPMDFDYEIILTIDAQCRNIVWDDTFRERTGSPFRFPLSMFSGLANIIRFDGNEIENIRKKLAFSTAFANEVEGRLCLVGGEDC
ncbi:hypothetical protein [Marivivens marinus]|uniref:hypothetical protein n=1 Tax=Marivivens marinus TaxID=3110173 RepID=UPI003B84A1FB